MKTPPAFTSTVWFTLALVCTTARADEADAIAASRAWFEKAFSGVPVRTQASCRLTIVHEDGAGDTKLGLCAFGTPMRLGAKTYIRGIGVNSRSVLKVSLDRPAASLRADIGLDRNVDGTAASATMHVQAGGRELFATPVLRPDGSVQTIDVPLHGATSLELVVNDGGNGRGWDQADWADARVVLDDGMELWLDDLARHHEFAGGVPFAFVFGDTPSAACMSTWQRTFQEETAGPVHRGTLTLTDPATGLEVRAVCVRWDDAAGVDWTVNFTNKGPAYAPALHDVRALDVAVALGIGAAPIVHRLKGSTCAVDDWLPFDQPLPPGTRVEFGAVNGRASADSPFWSVDWGQGGLIAAIGWSGQWRGAVEHGKGSEVRVRAGMERTHLRLRPGESIRTPRCLLLPWSGGTAEEAANFFRRTMRRHIVPRIDNAPVVPPIAHLSTSFYEMNASTETNVRAHLDAIRGLGFEMFWLDAYWTRDGFPAGMGHYGFPIERAEPRDRFPRGLAPIGAAVRAAGLKYLMWFEPERVHPGTALAREHPEWVISPAGDGSGLFNLGIPEAREYMTRYLCAAIRTYGLDCVRIDFNIDPLPFWEHLNSKDPERVGMAEIRYIEGLYAMWDEILRANPRLFIDNCASGGRRIDLETCARAIPLWRSDNTCDMTESRPETIVAAAMKNQVMSAGLNRYVPYSVVGQMGTSPYLFRSGFNGGIAFAQDCRPSTFPRDALRDAIAEARRIRPYWEGDFHVLSDVNLDPAAWCVLQYHRPHEGDGIVVAFRRPRSAYASFDAALRGIDPNAEYEIWESPTYRRGDPARVKGDQLARLRVHIDEQPGATIVEYRRVQRTNAAAQPPPAEEMPPEPGVLSAGRQLTLAGERAGEGYFSPDGRTMIFQSERESGNPFFQIYLMDMTTGRTRRLSNGIGRTTCAWLHPSMQKALFSSTHEDPEARTRQAEEIERRKSQSPDAREPWSYDPHYDLYEIDLASGALKKLTSTRGYDAEGSYSPDGRTIVFASNREAYAGGAEPEKDAERFMDLYAMDADGSNVRRLTTSPGYDGGPFFSADGNRIVWRRFSEDGLRAEIYTMPAQGGPERRLTNLGAMSWAPFFHPSGAYIVFTTNRHGMSNFELYIVDAEGLSEPARITCRPGFDGLPAFTPDGRTLVWTSNRTPNAKGQLFMADWDHEAARALLRGKLPPAPAAKKVTENPPLPALVEGALDPAIVPEDLYRHVTQLTAPEMGGRLAGTEGELRATEYVASTFQALGLAPAGSEDSFFHEFQFTAGVSLGPGNRLTLEDGAQQTFKADTDWRPVSFSATGEFGAAPVVFAGYGIVAPAADGSPAYDSYKDLDVKGAWVLVLRYIPEDVSQERRVNLTAFASLRLKAMEARERGAAGLIVATGPRSQSKDQLVRMALEGSAQGISIPVVSVSDRVAELALARSKRRLEDLQAELDPGAPRPGFRLDGVTVAAAIDLVKEHRKGRNVLARLPGASAEPALLIGAHVDHIGKGEGHDSLARAEERGQVHAGADDNASGVAALLEVAQHMASMRKDGTFRPALSVVFAAWSGEEMGLLGSSQFVGSQGGGEDGIRKRITAYINMDMVGRLSEKLLVFGVGSSSAWASLVERCNVPLGLPIVMAQDQTLPTDTASFAGRKVPFLSLFTGVHGDYHSPRDTADRLGYTDLARIARLVDAISREVSAAGAALDYREMQAPAKGARGGGGRARVLLGTVPDFAGGDVKGAKLSGTTPGSPAEKAGIKAGDIVVELAGKKIENLYDYSFAIGALKAGVPTEIVIERDGKRMTFSIVPVPRE